MRRTRGPIGAVAVAVMAAAVLTFFGGCASTRTAFEESMKQYPNAWDSRKLRHSALRFLVREYAQGTPRNSPERLLLNELDGLNVHEPPDSARAEEIYALALRYLDPDKLTPENEFFAQLDERLDWIAHHSCWHPFNALALQLDDLAEDVIRFGVPEVLPCICPDSIGCLDCPLLQVAFPQVGGETRAYSLPKYVLDYVRVLPPTLAEKPDGYYWFLRLIAEKAKHIYYAVEYDPLPDNCVLAEAVAVPGPGPANWDGNPDHYGQVPWHNSAAVFNVAVKAQPFVRKDTTGHRAITIHLAYTIMNPRDRHVLDSGSLVRVLPVDSSTGQDTRVILQAFTDWFHTQSSLGEKAFRPPVKDYLLGLRVSDPDGRTWEQSYHLSLPGAPEIIPVYEAMLVTGPQGKNRMLNFPLPRVSRMLNQGEATYVWLPVTDLPGDQEKKAYCGYVKVYLIPKFDLRGHVRIGPLRYADSADAETLPTDEGLIRARGVEVSGQPLCSSTPNSYYAVPIVIPRVPDGPYTLAVIVHAGKPDAEKRKDRKKPLCAAFVEVTVD